MSSSDGGKRTFYYQRGWGPAALLGWSFVCFGGILLFFGTRFDEEAVQFAGAALLFVGLVGLLFRSGVDLDLENRLFTRWMSLLFPMRWKAQPLGLFDRVVLLKRAQWSAHRASIYQLRLESGGVERLFLSESGVLEAQRSIALDLAQRLNISLLDRTLGTKILTEHAHLEENFVARARRERSQFEHADVPPAQPVSRLEKLADGVRLHIPKRGLSRRTVAILLGGVLVNLATGLLEGWLDGFTPRGLVGFAVSVAVVVLWTTAAAIADARASWVVEASPAAFRLRKAPLAIGREIYIPGSALRDLVVGDNAEARGFFERVLDPGTTVTARGAGITASFASHLSEEEKRWIRDLLGRALVGAEGRAGRDERS